MGSRVRIPSPAPEILSKKVLDSKAYAGRQTTKSKIGAIPARGVHSHVAVDIRANTGGTRLGKSDLLFSLLGASCAFAEEKMEGLLEALNAHRLPELR
jgi:hypothetical protein